MRVSCCCIVSVVALIVGVGWVHAEAGVLSRGPYLQSATPASVVVVWRTTGKSVPVLRYGTAPDKLDQRVTGDAITLRVSVDVDSPATTPRLFKESDEDAAQRDGKDHDPSTAPNTYQFEARVAGLRPATQYFYSVYDGDQHLQGGDADHFFVTLPAPGSLSSTRIWVLGDSGKGTEDQRMVFEAMRAYETVSGRPVAHFIHVGDMAYDDGTDYEFQQFFFQPYQTMLRNTVCWPSMGNHEGVYSMGLTGHGPYYDAYVLPTAGESGGAPSGSEAYYAFDIGDAHFICLDSHDLDRDPEGAMAQWLRADLEQTNAKWLIAFWHHPPYSKGTHDSDREPREIDMRVNFMPILESAGVDLTLTGHSHIYERSMLMDGAYATPTVAEGVILDDGDGNPDGDGAYRKSDGLHPHEGSVAIVAGHGGTTNGRMGTMPVMRQIIVDHGSVLLDIDGDTLTGYMVDKHGATRDVFSIVKRGSVTPKRVENPWQPVHDLSLLTRHSLDFGDDSIGGLPAHWRVATGSSDGLTVAPSSEGARKIMQASAGDDTLIGLFEGIETDLFRFDTLVRIPDGDTSVAGIVFSFEDKANYWQLILDSDKDTLRISQIAGGEEKTILEDAVSVERGKWLKLKLDISYLTTEYSFEDGPARKFQLDTSLPTGHLGVIVPAGGTAEYYSFHFRKHFR